MTAAATLQRPHVWQPGTTSPPLLLLHGTGGDEHDLLPLREHLAPGAAVLSPRGTVLEHGMPRFFRRLREGVFDEDDLRAQTDDLAGFLRAAQSQHAVPAGSWMAVGFSNGANIASALLLRHPELLTGAVLIAAMVPFRHAPTGVDLTGKRIAVVNGRRDPMATPQQSRTLLAQLRAAGAQVTEIAHDGGHVLDPALLPVIRDFIAHTGPPA